ncbi:MAG: hypothetical protein IPK67_18410 [Planctomycetes bacterium]|nr:hypothetical protein [Planctomycetota bacterium]
MTRSPTYRLRKVKTQGGVLVAEYRYNGLGYRVGEHWDVNASGLPVDGSDPCYYSAYDERWRMVATYRSSDTDPKERFVHQQAGDGGFGGSSCIDLVAFREKDANTAWTSASDGTLEERLYYCQSQHADVVALITAAGGQREMDRYSAYGVPFGLPTGDCDSDGDCDVADRNQVQAWINASNQYDVRGDIDLDGDTDSTDKTNLRNNFEGVTLGWGVLSDDSVTNVLGLAAYHAAPGISTGGFGARKRILNSSLGTWNRRDPIGYSAGDTNLYRMVFGAPHVHNDPFGEDCPGCTVPSWIGGGALNSSPCALACCAKHDECYKKYGCTAASWANNAAGAIAGSMLGGLGAMFGSRLAAYLSKCAGCNQDVVDCIIACPLTGTPPRGTNCYYCPKTQVYINIADGPCPPVQGLPNYGSQAAADAACCD